jgi:hypothetical protein
MRHLFVSLLALTLLAAPCLAAELIVDQGHAAAADGNPGTADKPFKTIGAAVAQLAPGDTVTVRAGTYHEQVTVKRGGTADKPVTLRAAEGQRVVISPRAEGDRFGITWTKDAAHLTIQGFHVLGGEAKRRSRGIGSSDKGSHHITISDCAVIGSAI